jgi:hypothetical protein
MSPSADDRPEQGSPEKGRPEKGNEDQTPQELPEITDQFRAASPQAPAQAERTDDDQVPLSLSEGDAGGGTTKMRFTSAREAVEDEKNYTRPLNADGSGATRCRIFHSKIAESPIEYLQKQINEWLDGSKIEVKHVGHMVGTMEGKNPVPNLIVMVWY